MISQSKMDDGEDEDEDGEVVRDLFDIARYWNVHCLNQVE